MLGGFARVLFGGWLMGVDGWSFFVELFRMPFVVRVEGEVVLVFSVVVVLEGGVSGTVT